MLKFILLPGTGALFPAHKHDSRKTDPVTGTLMEASLEEIYFYKIDKPQGFAIQKVYTDDRSLDEIAEAHNNDVVLIPKGYHPVVAGHGYNVYYLNFLAGSDQSLASTDDPDHKWIYGTWKGMDPRIPVVTIEMNGNKVINKKFIFMKTNRLTVGQAVVRFLKNQYVERDGIENPFFAGCLGIFGHGIVAGVGEGLMENPDFRYYMTRNEQASVHIAIAYAKMKNRLGTFACISSIGPGATNMITGAACATINRLPVLIIPGRYFCPPECSAGFTTA